MVSQNSKIEASQIENLIHDLENPDGLVCQRVRRLLVTLGPQAVPYLIQALSNPNPHVRWEAAEALTTISEPSAAEALVRTLEDEDVSVRWAATQGLIAFGRASIAPLLTALTKRLDSVWLREGAHHVFHHLLDQGKLYPAEITVYNALGNLAPEMVVPWAAETALKALNQSEE
jgi:HEAT repeat protein